MTPSRDFWTSILIPFLVLVPITAMTEPVAKDTSFAFSFPDLEGKVVSSSDDRFKGKAVYVDIWGTTCPPCRREMPVLSALYRKYKEAGLEIVGLAFEYGADEKENVQKVKTFVEEFSPSYTILYGGQADKAKEILPVMKELIPVWRFSEAFPSGVFIGRDGKVKHVKFGFKPDETPAELEHWFDKLTKEKPVGD